MYSGYKASLDVYLCEYIPQRAKAAGKIYVFVTHEALSKAAAARLSYYLCQGCVVMKYDVFV